jgi:D-amino-acid dehydrogenase
MTPDGVPRIGATRIDGVFVNAGHGHLGWTLAAGSGQLLAAVMSGLRSPLNAADYALR